jgi:hypothetical protein
MLSAAVILSLFTSSYAFAPRSMKVAPISSLSMADIVDTAVGAGSFKTLAAALTGIFTINTIESLSN